MIAETVKYKGSFRFKPKDNPFSKEIPGVLYRKEDGTIVIEVLENPEFGNIREEHYDVMWGTIGSTILTFFNLKLTHFADLSSNIYTTKLAVMGVEISSIKDKCFNGCQIKFPNLINWICDSSSIIWEKSGEFIVIKDTDRVNGSIQKTALPDVNLHISFDMSISQTFNRLIYSKDCYINCLSAEKQSVDYFVKLTFEISRFFSYIMFGKQKCCSLELLLETEVHNYYQVWFSLEQDTSPKHNHLISYQCVKDRLPFMLQQWHKYFSELIPMVNQLLYPLSFVDFGYIDFLRFAHALEGLQKRFAGNVFDTKNSYKERIKNLIDHLKNYKVIEECKIDASLVAKTRNKYTHLGKNDVEDDIPKEELYLLTLKCKVLLASSILLVLGLSEQEIENCTYDSELNNIVNYICAKENRMIIF